MENNNAKTQYITSQDLENQTQILLAAFDQRFDKLDRHIIKTKEELKQNINNVQTLIDGYVKAQESFHQEFEIMKTELSQIKKIIKEKLGLEIKVF